MVMCYVWIGDGQVATCLDLHGTLLVTPFSEVWYVVWNSNNDRNVATIGQGWDVH